jgi:Mg-chelatase subunit ChlD
VDNSEFPKVTVYVSVTNADGEPVAVDPNGIELAENGQAVTPESTGGEGEIGALTSLLVVDVSGSMLQADKLQSAKAAALAYVDQMRPGDQAGLLTFNTAVKYVQPVTADREALRQPSTTYRPPATRPCTMPCALARKT